MLFCIEASANDCDYTYQSYHQIPSAIARPDWVAARRSLVQTSTEGKAPDTRYRANNVNLS